MSDSGMRSKPSDRGTARYAGVVSDVTTAVRSAPPARPSLRDRKKDATRQLIEDTAWQLFIDRGYDATTVHDIAEAANVAPRTFFRYFPSKEAVLFPELDEVMEELAVAFAARPHDEPALVSLIAAMDDVADEFSEDRERKYRRFEMLRRGGQQPNSAFVTSRISAAVEEMVRRRQAGDPDGDLQARLAGGILSLVVSISNEQWLAGGATSMSTFEDETKNCFDTIRRLVVGTPRGVATERG